MRHRLFFIAAIAVAGLSSTACNDTSNCELMKNCGGGGGSGGSAGGSGGGGSGGSQASCVPSDPAWSADEACGVFVATSGADAAPGTPTEPVATLAAAIASGKQNIYLCADETFVGGLELPGGVSVYGGVDCNNGWAYIATGDGMHRSTIEATTELAGSDDVVGLVINGTGVEAGDLADLLIEAGDAALPGGSSIGLIAKGVALRGCRCAGR